MSPAKAQSAESWQEKAFRWGQTIKSLASQTFQVKDKWHKSYEELQQFEIKKQMDSAVEKLQKIFKNQKSSDPSQKKEANRQFLESLGEMSIGSGSATLNNYARRFIKNYCPSLIGTDYFNDPAKAISYYLVLDGKGFIEKVKLIRGPFGTPMTLKEAYEYYTGTDPEKAEKILIMMEQLQKLGSKDTDQNKVKHILKAIKTNLELINKSKK